MPPSGGRATVLEELYFAQTLPFGRPRQNQCGVRIRPGGRSIVQNFRSTRTRSGPRPFTPPISPSVTPPSHRPSPPTPPSPSLPPSYGGHPGRPPTGTAGASTTGAAASPSARGGRTSGSAAPLIPCQDKSLILGRPLAWGGDVTTPPHESVGRASYIHIRLGLRLTDLEQP